MACVDRQAIDEECKTYLAEQQVQILREFKMQLESDQEDLRERLQSLREEREKQMAETGGDAESGTSWGEKIVGVLPQLLVDDPSEEDKAVTRNLEDIDQDIAEVSMLAQQQDSAMACTDLRITGENCDSPAVDDYVRSALDGVKEQLSSDLRGLRAELASGQAELAQLAELEALMAERRQVENEIEENEKAINQNEVELECATRLVAGEGLRYDRRRRASIDVRDRHGSEYHCFARHCSYRSSTVFRGPSRRWDVFFSNPSGEHCFQIESGCAGWVQDHWCQCK